MIFGFQEDLEKFITTGEIAYNPAAITAPQLIPCRVVPLKVGNHSRTTYQINQIVKIPIRAIMTAGPAGLNPAKRRAGAII